MTSTDVRRTRLSTWAKRVISDKLALEEWTMQQLIDNSGVSKDTVYQIRNGTWKHMPKAVTVEKFCENLDLSVEEPLEILGYHRPGGRSPQPIRSEIARDLDRVMHDPNVPGEKKRMITDMVRGLIREYLPKPRPKRHSA